MLSGFGGASSYSAASLYSGMRPDWMNHLSSGRAAWVPLRAVVSSAVVCGASVGSFVRSVWGHSRIMWSNVSASAPHRHAGLTPGTLRCARYAFSPMWPVRAWVRRLLWAFVSPLCLLSTSLPDHAGSRLAAVLLRSVIDLLHLSFYSLRVVSCVHPIRMWSCVVAGLLEAVAR